jgi:imidazoleglycerol phosphate dehydratase HisB
MFSAFAKHGHFDLTMKCKGDLEIDDHHTAEDCALALGSAVDQALGERKGMQQFSLFLNATRYRQIWISTCTIRRGSVDGCRRYFE